MTGLSYVSSSVLYVCRSSATRMLCQSKSNKNHIPYLSFPLFNSKYDRAHGTLYPLQDAIDDHIAYYNRKNVAQFGQHSLDALLQPGISTT